MRAPTVAPGRLSERRAGYQDLMVRIGLVLGGGGYAGQAYHAGTLAALEHDTGWSGRDADVTWPDRPLWIAAVRRRDGRRVVFGKDGPRVALVDALAASCAVPGYFAPVRIHGHEYLDGGAHSSTNADVLAPEGLDLVVVIAPLAAAGTTPRSGDGVVHRIAARRLRQEIAALERTGTHVLVFEPGPDTVDTIGHDLMRSDVHDVVQASFLEAGARIAAAEYQSVRWLSTRGHRRAPVVTVPGGP